MYKAKHGMFIGVLASLSVLGQAPAAPMGTAITYQGQLKQGGVPVNDSADLVFTLWDAEADGDQIGLEVAVTIPADELVNGLFTVELDFGPDAFTGDARWLEISVRSPAGSGDFITLSPRQRLTPVPFALALPALHTLQNATSPNIVAGWDQNEVTDGVVGATLSGGGSPLISGNPRPNRVTDNYGTISGGSGNRAGDGDADLNDANHATVGGGYANDARGPNSTIAGGWGNQATNGRATVGGGWNNLASGNAATISGGRDNNAAGTSGVVGGGHGNSAANQFATIGGGYGNQATADYATIGGGGRIVSTDAATANFVTDQYGTVGGGGQNQAGNGDGDATNARYTTVGGGVGNGATAASATVAGGEGNTASGGHAAIGGGHGNVASHNYATVGGGLNNAATSLYNTIAGGWNNQTSHGRTTIGGGRDNVAAGDSATIGGGHENETAGIAATIPGGSQNSALGNYSFAAGRRAKADNVGAFVWADSTDADFESTDANQFLIRASGGVGIGTTSPSAQLDVVASDGNAVHAEGTTGGVVATGGSTGVFGQGHDIGVHGVGSRGVFGYGATGVDSWGSDTGVLGTGINYGVRAENVLSGNYAHLGTSSQGVYGFCLTDYGAAVHGQAGSALAYAGRFEGSVQVTGQVSARTVRITGGSDIAEPFEVCGEKPIEPGMVVVIDPTNAGQLKVATEPYDRKVAGIISGANGLKPGMVMKAEGNEYTSGDWPVALTGRVWCRCDASTEAIAPGDLLTSSATPGHAMKVSDHARAQGAILGKAMTSLDKDTGLVLVLVSLQ